MYKRIMNFDYKAIEKYKFNKYESPISRNNIDIKDINKIVVSNKFPFGKQDIKYFIGYKDVKKLDICAYSFQK